MARVPTLPTPTTLRAMSTNRYVPNRYCRSSSRLSAYRAISSCTYSVSSSGWALSNSVAKGDEQGRHASKAQLAVDPLGQPPDGPQARLAPRLGERFGEHDPAPLASLPPKRSTSSLAFKRSYQTSRWLSPAKPRIPWRYSRTHAFTSRRRRSGRKPDVAPRDLHAGRHPLDVPLPRPGEGLVEVIWAEYESAIRSCKPPEVGDVSIAARLHDDTRVRGRRQVRRHDRRRSTVEHEWGDEHPSIPDRDEFLYARGRLGRQHRDRIRPVRCRRPVAMR